MGEILNTEQVRFAEKVEFILNGDGMASFLIGMEHAEEHGRLSPEFVAIVKAIVESRELLRADRDALAEALRGIRNVCHWYADVHAGPEHEVHHALKVELLDATEKALAVHGSGEEPGA